MSRHHHRFERDYRGPWERRDVRPTGLHNGGANHSCASAVVNGNNRPGLLPLPVIPSLLPTPVTVAVTTSSSDIAVKRGISAAGSVASASAKVSTPLTRRPVTSGESGSLLSLPFCGNDVGRTLPGSTSAFPLPPPPSFRYLSHSAKISGPCNFLSSWFSCQTPSAPPVSAASSLLHPSLLFSVPRPILTTTSFLPSPALIFFLPWWKRPSTLLTLLDGLRSKDVVFLTLQF